MSRVIEMKKNEMMEMIFQAPEPEGCHVDVDLVAEIIGPDGEKNIKGFYAGQGIYKIRFLPEKAGKYLYTIRGVVSEKGTLTVTESDEGYHGVVRAEGIHFKYQDGKNFVGFGTTVYALAHQKDEIINQTMDTLSKRPFNKVRMCLFPKHYNYNHNEPMNYAFRPLSGKENCVFTEENKDVYMKETVWDVHHPDFTFWDSFEKRLQQLFDLGIQVDLILFHPYDRWGFSTMSRKDNLTYLDYVIWRLAAYPNIWWSLANEYDLCFAKSMDDSAVIWWAKGGKLIGESPERIAFLRKIVDSFPGPLEAYPTGISKVLSMPQEQMKAMMVYVSDEMRCFGAALMSMDSLEMNRHMDSETEYTGHVGDEVILYYCDVSCYARRVIELPAGRRYRIEVIDTWNMTRETIAEHVSGQGEQSTYEVRMQLPAKEYMAILCTAEE